jgi:hypothetical protein
VQRRPAHYNAGSLLLVVVCCERHTATQSQKKDHPHHRHHLKIVLSVVFTDDLDISEAFRNPPKLSSKEAQEAREAADRSTDLSSGKGKGKKNISHVVSGTPPPQKRHKLDIV